MEAHENLLLIQGAHSALIYYKYPEGVKKKKFDLTFNVDSDPS